MRRGASTPHGPSSATFAKGQARRPPVTNPQDPYGYDPYSYDPYSYDPLGRVPFEDPFVGPPAVTPPPRRPPVNALATLSLLFAFVFPPAGAILGHLGLAQIRRTGELGRDRALAGLALPCGVIQLTGGRPVSRGTRA